MAIRTWPENTSVESLNKPIRNDIFSNWYSFFSVRKGWLGWDAKKLSYVGTALFWLCPEFRRSWFRFSSQTVRPLCNPLPLAGETRPKTAISKLVPPFSTPWRRPPPKLFVCKQMSLAFWLPLATPAINTGRCTFFLFINKTVNNFFLAGKSGWNTLNIHCRIFEPTTRLLLPSLWLAKRTHVTDETRWFCTRIQRNPLQEWKDDAIGLLC